MADTGSEHITDTFQFCHHAIPVPTITATDRILYATARLTAAIKSVQEAPPNELAAIQALGTLLLGEVPPTEPTSPQVRAPRPINDDEPVFIWSPENVQKPTRDVGINSPTSVPSRTGTLAIIEDDTDNKSFPPILLRHSPRTNITSSATARARLNVHTAHMMNCVIANHVLTEAQLPSPTKHAPACLQGYVFVAHLIHNNELLSTANTSEHFIGAVIDDTMEDVLEY